MGEGTNGERFDRALKASAGYEDLVGKFDELDIKLFGDTHLTGVLPRILASVERLERNPMIRFGSLVHSTGRAIAAFVLVLGTP